MQWTAAELLNQTETRLQSAGVDSPRLDAELLLASALQTDRLRVLIEPRRVVSPDVAHKIQELTERRADREPMSQILGRREFWSLDFKVNRTVLTPRPETEILVEHFLSLAKERKTEPLNILDLGTGSGILAIVAALELKTWRATAVDRSLEALETARENACAHGVQDRIEFVRSDWFERVTPAPQFDFILCNPPYIPEDYMERLAPDVKVFEPDSALNGGADGLDCFRRIVPEAGARLKPGGYLLLEMWRDQAAALGEIFLRAGGWSVPETIKDYAGLDRVAVARRLLERG